MHLSLTPVLLATELGFLFLLAGRVARRGAMTPVFVYGVWLSLYAVATSIAGARGWYVAESLMPWLPGLWLQLITVAAFLVPVALSAGLRGGLRRIVDVTPWHWFAWFHGLRIAALGTLAKTASGEFPLYFALLVGLPDLAFGLSAWWVAARARRRTLSARTFMTWNLIGALIIVPAAPVLLQLGLPGPLQVFTGLPDARAVFTYPMSIAPMIGVPMFVMVNLWVAWRLWETRAVRPVPA